MNTIKPVIGKILYAGIFLLALPVLLWLWATQTAGIVRYPSIQSSFWGAIISFVGGALMLWGMFALMRYGKGLPMNAFPPEKLVQRGPYRLLQHPIYWGFGTVLVGISIFTGSASGLWLVTPVTILGMIALVWGYERITLQQRFPTLTVRAYLDLPGKAAAPAGIRDRFSALFWLLFALLISNFLLVVLVGEISPLWGEPWRIYPIFTDWPGRILGLLFVVGTPLILTRQDRIRHWCVATLIALTTTTFIALLWPTIGCSYLPPENTTDGLPLTLLSVPLFLILLSLRAYMRQFSRVAVLFFVVALFLGFYQLTNSRASALHLLVAIPIWLLADYYLLVWTSLKNTAEKIANSWKEWVFGSVRVINHGFYVGFGTFAGILLAGWLAGPAYAWAILVFALVVIIFSALWAQLIEGSEKLKRPFGYYGALVGIIFASLSAWSMGYNVWVLIGVISVVMPWVQALGRLRCLINGCCHGRPIDNSQIGIRYYHPRSRVCGISGLQGKLLHPTPLYSILWLSIVGFLLLSFWKNHFPYPFIFGLYLILTSIGRFIEEAYRGEVQTPILKNLRLYQWTAIASMVIGMVMTIIQVPLAQIDQVFGWEVMVVAFLGGMFTFFAMGVDFPRSNARFSRLV